MSKYDAERALAVYKTFTKQTNYVVEFLSTARQYENATRLEIPKLKHAPTSLTSSLEEYLKDPDFESNRRQYLAQQDAKKGRKTKTNGTAEPTDEFSKLSLTKGGTSKETPNTKPAKVVPTKSESKGPDPDLIDFFDSIEQNQQPMASAAQQQISSYQTGIPYQQQQQPLPEQTRPISQPQNIFPQPAQQPQPQNGGTFTSGNPFNQSQIQQPVQPNFTRAGFGGYNQQSFDQQQNLFSSVPQNNAPQLFQPQQSFRTGQDSIGPPQQSLIAPQSFATGQQSQSSNPFRQSVMQQITGLSTASYSSSPPQSTNPFARNVPNQPSGLLSNMPFSSQQPAQGTPFTSPPPTQQQQNTPLASSQAQQQPQTGPNSLTPHRTGTNPFARTASPQNQQFPSAAPMVSNPTGTNPFRQSVFVNQQTGQGWQANQGTMGGFEQLDTVPIFPRPGQPQHQGAWP